MFSGAYLHLIGGKILWWYYYYYTWILRDHIKLNITDVFRKIQNLTKVPQWKNKKITVKLFVLKGKINKITITNYIMKK